MSFVEWINFQLAGFSDLPELLQALAILICFVLVYEFYHLLFSAVLTWFKK